MELLMIGFKGSIRRRGIPCQICTPSTLMFHPWWLSVPDTSQHHTSPLTFWVTPTNILIPLLSYSLTWVKLNMSSDESQIPHLKPLTHLSVKHLVISPDYFNEFIWAHIYRYAFRESVNISAVLIRTSHPHGRRAILLLAGLEKFQKARFTRTTKAKLLVNFPQKLYLFLHQEVEFFHI